MSDTTVTVATSRPALMKALEEAKAGYASIFPNWSNGLSDASPTAAPSLDGRTRPLLRRFFASVDAALSAIAETVIEATTLQGSPSSFLSEEGNKARVTDRIRAGGMAYAAALAAATVTIERLSEDFNATGVPQRPEPADAAQEARLANLRADVRMMLDPVQPADLSDRIAAMVSDSVTNHDDLRTWFLAGSTWPADYLTSRGVRAPVDRLSDAVGRALAQADLLKDQVQALRAARLTDEGRHGVMRITDTWLPSVYEFELAPLVDETA